VTGCQAPQNAQPLPAQLLLMGGMGGTAPPYRRHGNRPLVYR
jgi:hypothetical protein